MTIAIENKTKISKEESLLNTINELLKKFEIKDKENELLKKENIELKHKLTLYVKSVQDSIDKMTDDLFKESTK